jgi:hypothetical protein
MAGTTRFPGFSSVDILPGGGTVLASDPCNGEVVAGHYDCPVEAPVELDSVVILAFSEQGVTAGPTLNPQLNPKISDLEP